MTSEQAFKVKIGIIGGTGLSKIELFQNSHEVEVVTPFGKPSDKLLCGMLNGVECVLLSRHDRAHSTSPSKINYRANLLALKQLGCHVVIATTACGSLSEEYKPGDIVILDDFVDQTKNRARTLYDGSADEYRGVLHMPMHPAFCAALSAILVETCALVPALSFHKTGTMLSIEGPRFSSRAESRMFKNYAQLINMTTCPEVVIAKELGMPYASIAIVTDYDCWRESDEAVHVDVQSVLEVFKQSLGKVTELIVRAVARVTHKDWSDILASNAKMASSNLM